MFTHFKLEYDNVTLSAYDDPLQDSHWGDESSEDYGENKLTFWDSEEDDTDNASNNEDNKGGIPPSIFVRSY